MLRTLERWGAVLVHLARYALGCWFAATATAMVILDWPQHNVMALLWYVAAAVLIPNQGADVANRLGYALAEVRELQDRARKVEPVVQAARLVRMSYDHDEGRGMSSEHQQCVAHLNTKVDEMDGIHV